MVDAISGPAIALSFYSMLWAHEPHAANVLMGARTCEVLRLSNEWASIRMMRQSELHTPRFMSECMPPHMMRDLHNPNTR